MPDQRSDAPRVVVGPAQLATETPAPTTFPAKPLPAAAKRALAEAAARRAKGVSAPSAESGGRGGLDPVRYGDWEIKGLAADF